VTAIDPALEDARADLFELLAPLPDVALWPTVPDATGLPAVWIDQPAGGLSPISGVITAAWAIVCAVDTATATTSTSDLDLLAGAVIALAVAGPFRLTGWTRGTTEVGGVSLPAVTVDVSSDHVLC